MKNTFLRIIKSEHRIATNRLRKPVKKSKSTQLRIIVLKRSIQRKISLTEPREPNVNEAKPSPPMVIDRQRTQRATHGKAEGWASVPVAAAAGALTSAPTALYMYASALLVRRFCLQPIRIMKVQQTYPPTGKSNSTKRGKRMSINCELKVNNDITRGRSGRRSKATSAATAASTRTALRLLLSCRALSHRFETPNTSYYC